MNRRRSQPGRSLGSIVSLAALGSVTFAVPVLGWAQAGRPAVAASASVSAPSARPPSVPAVAASASTAVPRPGASIAAAVPVPSTSAAVPVSSVAPSASASASLNGLAPPTVKPTTAYTMSRARKLAPPAPPPTPEQLAALAALKVEADTYAKGAADYSDTVTKIIRLHYEEKKREVLSTLDKDIAIEKAELKKARDVAILRLQEFVAKYSGARSQPVETPDAMYRLAALYEERARDSEAEDLSGGLKPAIDLYKQIIREFPRYQRLASIYYFLGHAYNDSNRIPEAMQVWRSLVCHNHFAYPTAPDPKNPDADTIIPLPQDHDEEYWSEWRRLHHDEKSLRKGGPDTQFIDPYPADCQSLPQPTLNPGEQPLYVDEAWWRIGDWEFDQQDLGGGFVKSEPGAVYDYNRAASAYTHSLQFKRWPVYGVSLYRYSWSLFKQQRYETSVHEFIRLLNYTDELLKDRGDPGSDFRTESYTYIASSLTNINFKGPEANDPFIQEVDILDLEPNPVIQEKKLHIAIDRVKDPAIIPQDKPWTIDIYKALAAEYRSLNEYHNAIEVYQDILRKWPMDPTAPDVQNDIAETYEQLNTSIRAGTPEHDQNAAKALEARTALAGYIGTTPWTDANKDNPAALQNAERLVRGGLRQAAVQHTYNGAAELAAAGQTGDAKSQVEHLARAVAEYKLAAAGWEGFWRQEENAPDAYESRYWLADAKHKQVKAEVLLHKLQRGVYPEPSPEEIDSAKQAAIAVRDSNEDEKYLEKAAFFVVDESDIEPALEAQRWDETRGASGIEPRTGVKFDGTDPETRKVVTDPIPPSVQAAMAAREEYVQRVPPNLDVAKRAMDYEWQVADSLFIYGHFDEAKAHFEPMYRDHCGKDVYGYKAWDRLLSMASVTRDADRARQLAEAEKNHSCVVTGVDAAANNDLVKNIIQASFYQDAGKVFKEAQDAKPGPARDALWRKAAAMYDAALAAAPARDEAPEAAINGAICYKQVGEFGKAIAMYDKFIAEYGSETLLNDLQKGNLKTGTPANPKKYEARVANLSLAYEALATAYVGFFSYQKAAETLEKIGANTRFDETKRKAAARTAMILYASMAEREKATANYKTLMSLHPTPDEKANADFLFADYDRKQWVATSPDSGANRQARQAAEAALSAFYYANRNNGAAARYDVLAAYWIFKMQKTVSDPAAKASAKTALAAWEAFRARAPFKDGKNEATLPPFVDYGAEAQYALIDDQIRNDYDIESHHKYAGASVDVLEKYRKDAVTALKFDEQLDVIPKSYASQEWVAAAYARKGSIFDTLRTGLYNAVPPAVKYFTAKQEAFLKRCETSGVQSLQDQCDDLRTTVKAAWRSKKESELADADKLMVKHYATAVAIARKYNVRNPVVTKAIERLAYFTAIIGNEKMREYVTLTKDPTDLSGASNLAYTNDMYLQSRPGLTATPPPVGAALPAPVAP